MELNASGVVTNWLTGGAACVAGLAGSLTQTLFDGGELRGQVQLADASRRELVETYLQTVLTSVKQVNDSLSAVSTADRRTMLLTNTVEQAQLALRLATTRYQAESDDLLTVLESQTSQLNGGLVSAGEAGAGECVDYVVQGAGRRVGSHLVAPR